MKKASPRAKAWVELLNRADKPNANELEVAFYSHDYNREYILRRGIFGYDVVGHTGGGANYGNYDAQRRRAERIKMGMSKEQSDKLPNELRPVYGLLRYLNPDRTKRLGNDSPPWYGRDAWIVKVQNIKKRMTLNVGDSYISMSDSKESNTWQDYFIPWKYRHLTIPNLLSEPKEGYKNINMFEDRGDVVWNEAERAALSGKKFREASPYLYLEVQAHGPVFPEDIVAFEFEANKRPPVEFLRELKRRGIEFRMRNINGDFKVLTDF